MTTMNCKFINVLMFAAGAAIGSVVTWKLVKTKYERIAQEEADAFSEAYTNMLADMHGQNTTDEDEGESDESHERTKQIDWSELEDLEEEDDDDRNEYARLVERYNNEKGGAENMASNIAKAPYVISPYDFGELDDYKQFELTYYIDGTLEDEDYNIVTDVDELIGTDALNTFGEYEDDAVFVRNEKLCADFQILKDYRTYEEARSVGPNQVANE